MMLRARCPHWRGLQEGAERHEAGINPSILFCATCSSRKQQPLPSPTLE
uniref:Uncharacterized protein n=1 Tax=Setaria viridis TaxID=4556 RepID=A0A4U6VNW4_SETVI|nr:hypothetical protein SEVIR_3G393250v2 [Setaria viridis]